MHRCRCALWCGQASVSWDASVALAGQYSSVVIINTDVVICVPGLLEGDVP